jgi:4-amino-4-deoxy-L-arabinose transferase-like glycosyltransferase
MKKYLSLIISLFLFCSVILFLIVFSLGQTDGHFLYTLDDPYIHMAIAKNFVTSGTWGVTQYEFSSCSSSPLWTFLISLFHFIFGTKVIVPFILNILFALLTAFIVFRFIVKYTDNVFFQMIILLSILFFGPFVSVVFTGLEHSMYTFFIVLIIYYLFKIFDEQSEKKDIIVLFILLALLTLSRYEGMFVAAALFLIFLYRKKVLIASGVLLSAFLPILIIGVISVSKGWYFFPNSIVLKSPVVLNDFGSFVKSIFNPNFFDLLWAYKRILILLIISAVMFFVYRKDKNFFAIKSSIFIFILVTLLQINFAKLGSLLRYEMYLIVFGILINIISIIKFLTGKSKKIKYCVIVFLCLLMIPFSISSIKAMKDVPTAITNIYQMQFQMSKFINNYYDKNTIALNDIGAVNYYCDIKCIDLWGLANKDVADYRRKQTYNSKKIFEINKNTSVAVVFEAWFDKYGGIPSDWIMAGKWTVPNNITCGADSVTFYATDSANYIKLTDNLKIFSKELPTQVKQKGY